MTVAHPFIFDMECRACERKMKKVITLTVNPAIDKSTTVAGIKPHSKLRCGHPVFEPGGGGLNVSRVIQELGGTSLCMYLAGGTTGGHLHEMLTDLDILQQVVPINGRVRENFAVIDTTNNQQYRFGMPGPIVNESEWKNTLSKLETVLSEDDFLVASGSLCPGMPMDFFSKVSKVAQSKKAKFILDTSGEALLKGVQAGVYLLKPNLGELATLCDLDSVTFHDLERTARDFLQESDCKILVVSMGAQGAMMVTENTIEYIAAPLVHQKSTIGAGDSMVAGMVHALAHGKSLSEMAKWGVACGTAATMTAGTQLCMKKDAEQLYQWIEQNAFPYEKKKIKAH